MSTTVTDTPEDQAPKPSLRRRAFLAGAGAGVAGTGLAAFTAAAGWPRTVVAQDDHDMSSGDSTEMTDEEMLQHHKDGIDKFLANVEEPLTEGVPIQPLESKVENGVRIFELTCQDIEWEVTPGETFQAMAFNGQVPGPLIRCTEGERIRVVVKNEMAQSTSIHWHGQMVPNDMDGIPFITQDPIKPGETFTYEFVAAGRLAHVPLAQQLGRTGRQGPPRPADRRPGRPLDRPRGRPRPRPDPERRPRRVHDQRQGLPGHDRLHGQGRREDPLPVHERGPRHPPDAPPRVPPGGHRPRRLATPQPYKCDTVNIAPGERWDVVVEASDPGVWVFHCHILSHAEGPSGMFGMVTALIVE